MRSLHLLHISFQSAESRIRYHVIMSYVWLIAMVIAPFLPTFHSVANLAALLIMEVSLYANFATEFGSIDAAKSSSQTQRNA